MYIFVDESGNFIASHTKPGVSLVGALVIADCRLAKLESKYLALRRALPKDGNEVKGRLLNEKQIADVVQILRRNEALVEIVAIDLNTHSAGDIDSSRQELANAVTRGLTSAHHSSIHAAAADLATRIRALNDPLFVQGSVMFELIRHVTELAIGYHSQRHPKELAEFFWTFDGKEKQRTTNWEKLWAEVLLPILQSKSVSEPMGLPEFGDFRYFERYSAPLPDWLPKPDGAADRVTDIKLLMTEHFEYSAASTVGLS